MSEEKTGKIFKEQPGSSKFPMPGIHGTCKVLLPCCLYMNTPDPSVNRTSTICPKELFVFNEDEAKKYISSHHYTRNVIIVSVSFPLYFLNK